MTQSATLRLEFQGSLVKAVTSGSVPIDINPKSKRGVVSPLLSRKSRKRLIERMARVEYDDKIKPKFLTLTYGREFPDPARAKRDLFTFWKRIKRIFPRAACVWKMEFQKRGAAHFHLILFNVPYIPFQDIRRWWGEVTGYTDLFVRIEVIRSKRRLMRYVAKYTAKVDDHKAFLDHVPYLTVGRLWGWLGRDHIPYATLVTIIFHCPPWQTYHQFRRYAAHVYKKLPRKIPRFGFMLLVDNPSRWRELWHSCYTA